MTATRDRILDAYRDEIAERGVSRVTLESVAARAGVSKGGLLYHFPAKQALTDGLADRLRRYTDDNLARAETEGAARTFLETSLPDPTEASHYWVVINAVHSDAQAVSDRTRQILHRVFEDWSGRLRSEIEDPVLADIIRLVGDGLYLATVTGLPVPSPDRTRKVIERLVHAATTSQEVAPVVVEVAVPVPWPGSHQHK